MRQAQVDGGFGRRPPPPVRECLHCSVSLGQKRLAFKIVEQWILNIHNVSQLQKHNIQTTAWKSVVRNSRPDCCVHGANESGREWSLPLQFEGIFVVVVLSSWGLVLGRGRTLFPFEVCLPSSRRWAVTPAEVTAGPNARRRSSRSAGRCLPTPLARWNFN